VTTPLSFNLWTESWIRVIRRDGHEDEIGIENCLEKSHDLIALSDPSPLVVGGTHRLLAAILQAIYQPKDVGDIAGLLGNKKFDETSLRQFEEKHAERFDLFHATAPFLQTGDVPLAWSDPQPHPVARLFAEVPVASERTHFTHVTDESHRFCPACCARGLVTIPAFASSGGRGFYPSINGVPPIYVLPVGDNLFETLTLSLISADFLPPTADPRRSKEAIWTTNPPVVQKGLEVSAVGYLESLTFPARRMRLYPQSEPTFCTMCGQQTPVFVSKMLFKNGHRFSKGAGIWEDPFVAFRKPRGSSKSKGEGPRPVCPEEGKTVWREYTNLLLKEDEAGFAPRAVRQVARLIDCGALADRQSIRFRCIGIRTDRKAKIFEWLDEALEAPPAILTDLAAAGYVSDALQQANEVARILHDTFNHHFQPERGQGGSRGQDFVFFKSVRERMIADYWRQMGMPFRQLINDLGDAHQRDSVAKNWIQTIVQVAQQCFNAALEQVGDRADALRARVEAKSACDRSLYAKRKEWLNE